MTPRRNAKREMRLIIVADPPFRIYATWDKPMAVGDVVTLPAAVGIHMVRLGIAVETGARRARKPRQQARRIVTLDAPPEASA
jgi:hypothetical protein